MKLKVTYNDKNRKCVSAVYDCGWYTQGATILSLYKTGQKPPIRVLSLDEIEDFEEVDETLKPINPVKVQEKKPIRIMVTYKVGSPREITCERFSHSVDRLTFWRNEDSFYADLSICMSQIAEWEVLPEPAEPKEYALSNVEQYLIESKGSIKGFYGSIGLGSTVGSAFFYNANPMDQYILRMHEYGSHLALIKTPEHSFLANTIKFLKEEHAKYPKDHPLWQIQ